MNERNHRDFLEKEIEAQEKLVASLEKKYQAARGRLSALKAELAELEERRSDSTNLLFAAMPTPSGPKTADEKIKLFRSLFRGREDAFPRYWISKKTGKSGYTPACDNEWVPGVCGKPRIKCGECEQRALTPVTTEVIGDHLRGRHVIGVYPMLGDETCWLLAIDFDKKAWLDDVGEFAETCR